MVEFRTLPADHPLENIPKFFEKEEPDLEKPIVPISQIGATVPEHDPQFKNMVQTVQSRIRRGAGTMQLMLQTPHEQAIGGRPKAYGKEIREAIREVMKANEVTIKGIEMPTQSLNNVSGFNHQQRMFDEEKRRRDVDEVKSAISFAADIGTGGGVDLVSFEFPRPVNDAQWQKRDEKTGAVITKKAEFWNPAETQMGMVVDARNGQVMMFRKDEKLFLQRDNQTFRDLTIKDEKTGELEKEIPEPQQWDWEHFQKWAKSKKDPYVNRFRKEHDGRDPTPEELYFYSQLDQQINQYRGSESFHESLAEGERRQIRHAQDRLAKLEKMPVKDEEVEQRIKEEKSQLRIFDKRLQDAMYSAAASRQQIAEVKYRKKQLKPVQDYGSSMSCESYAELGITALRETNSNPNAKSDLYVGPEIGWPHSYGGHPDEFIEIIKNSRKRMIKLMTNKRVKDPASGLMKDSEYYDENVTKDQAKSLARRHIKGMFDTGHMGMWWEHWKRDPKKSEEQNFKNFEQWYVDKVDEMIEADAIGGVQAVDSMTAAHGHLPPGQGIFGNVIKKSMMKLKEAGWTGMVVSEGHEEETFGEGRILYKTWEFLGGRTGPSYSPNLPGQSWAQMQHSYMGRAYSPLYMFGSYAPSNEFKLWSEVPLE